jgi:hypothetical protein
MAGMTADTVRDWSREAQDIALSDVEAAAVARTVETLAVAARAAGAALPFDSEPADYLRAQRRWLGGRR